MQRAPLVLLLLAPALLLALPSARAEPCVDIEREIRLPFVATPALQTPGIRQPDKHVGIDPPPVGPLDVGPVGADIPGFTLESQRVERIVIYNGDDLWVEWHHCF